MKKFPKSVYLEWEDGGRSEEPFLIVRETADDAAEVGEKKQVALYELSRMVTVENTTKVS